MSSSPSPASEAPGARADQAATPPLLSGPPAPGQTQPGPFPSTENEPEEPYHFLGAWHRLARAVGHGLQGGAYRCHQARQILKARR